MQEVTLRPESQPVISMSHLVKKMVRDHKTFPSGANFLPANPLRFESGFAVCL
jgi:hypothetical protein